MDGWIGDSPASFVISEMLEPSSDHYKAVCVKVAQVFTPCRSKILLLHP